MLWCSQSSVGKGMTPVRLFFRIRLPLLLLPPPLHATHVNTCIERERERNGYDEYRRVLFFGSCLSNEFIVSLGSGFLRIRVTGPKRRPLLRIMDTTAYGKDPLFNWNICISRPLILFKKKKKKEKKFVFFTAWKIDRIFFLSSELWKR